MNVQSVVSQKTEWILGFLVIHVIAGTILPVVV